MLGCRTLVHYAGPPQLTSLQALQNTLDILRSHRPAYTPRTGFVWPIVEPSSGDSAGKKRAQDGEQALDTQEGEGASTARGLTAGDSKRQQNNMLLFHAIRTTAAHAQESFQLPAAPAEDTVPETPLTATGGRSSVTPAPGPGGTATRAPSIAPTLQEPVTKGPPGAGKKKKKSKPCVAFAWSATNSIPWLLRDSDASFSASARVRVKYVFCVDYSTVHCIPPSLRYEPQAAMSP